MKKDVVIFDFDSTLVDSLGFWKKTIEKLSYKHYGVKPDNRLKGIIHGGNNLEKAKKVIKIFQVDDDCHKLLEHWKSQMAYFYTRKIKIIKQAREFLISLKEKGNRLIIASATDADLLKIALKHFDLDFFEEIYTENGLKISKNTPEFYETCLKLLKTDKESVLFFEDSYSAIKTAVEYGIECIGVNNKFNKNHKKDLNKLCKFTIKDFRDKKLDYLIK